MLIEQSVLTQCDERLYEAGAMRVAFNGKPEQFRSFVRPYEQALQTLREGGKVAGRAKMSDMGIAWKEK